MAMYRKLGKKTKLRKALLRNQVTALIYKGKIVTTEARAKEIQKIVEPMITLAAKYKDDFEEVTVQAKVARKDKDGKPFSCLAWTMKNGRRIEGMTVDMNIAKDEGWLAKNGSKWKTLPALMLRYRAASFFASLNCPEISLGLYTQEEILDGNFKEYKEPAEIREEVHAEIANNANQTEFEDSEPDMPVGSVTEPDGQQSLPFT